AHEFLDGVRAGLNRSRNFIRSAEAVLAEGEGRFDQALELYEEAAHLWEEHGCPLERGRGLFGAARCLLHMTKTVDALTHLREAQTIFASLGAMPLVEDVEELVKEL